MVLVVIKGHKDGLGKQRKGAGSIVRWHKKEFEMKSDIEKERILK